MIPIEYMDAGANSGLFRKHLRDEVIDLLSLICQYGYLYFFATNGD